jgi:nucleoside-triphosphatase THEP1
MKMVLKKEGLKMAGFWCEEVKKSKKNTEICKKSKN